MSQQENIYELPLFKAHVLLFLSFIVVFGPNPSLIWV